MFMHDFFTRQDGIYRRSSRPLPSIGFNLQPSHPTTCITKKITSSNLCWLALAVIKLFNISRFGSFRSWPTTFSASERHTKTCVSSVRRSPADGSPQRVKAVKQTARMLKEAGADTVYLQPCIAPHWVRAPGTGYPIGQWGHQPQPCALGNSGGTVTQDYGFVISAQFWRTGATS